MIDSSNKPLEIAANDKNFPELPEISVVVAFFNIEKCVRYCVDSLLEQTHQNYELILVDDGSVDGTSEILDEYASIENVTVLHKENGGLSDARNAGVGICSGRYITFVDGDDVVAPYYLEALSKAMDGSSTRMVIAQPRNVRFDLARFEKVVWEKPSYTYSLCGQEEAFARLSYEEIKTSAWAKLAPKWVYERHPFPKGRYYEEISTVADFMLELGEFALLDNPIYGYVMREDSIVHCKAASLEQVDDYILAIRIIAAVIRENYPQHEKGIAYHETLQMSRLYMLSRTAVLSSERKEEIARMTRNTARKNLRTILSDVNVRQISKMRFFLLALAPELYYAALRAYEKLTKRV